MKILLTKSSLYFSTKPISHFLQRSKKYPASNLQVFFLCDQKWSKKLISKRITRPLKWIKMDATAKVVKMRAWQQKSALIALGPEMQPAWFLQYQTFYAFRSCHKLRLHQVYADIGKMSQRGTSKFLEEGRRENGFKVPIKKEHRRK